MNKAKYTVVLKTLLDDEQANQKIQEALSTYPLYKQVVRENPLIPVVIPTREVLNNKILNYYKYHEIGFETVGRFLDELETAMCEIMPYYNDLLFSVDQDYDIRYNVDYDRKHTETKQGEAIGNVSGSENIHTDSEGAVNDMSTVNSEVNTYSKDVNVDTPQNLLSMPSAHSQAGNVDIAGADSVEYAESIKYGNNKNKDKSSTISESSTTGSTETTGTNNVETTNTNSETIEFNERTKGNYGQVSFQSLIRAYRENIVNVEQQIIRDRRIRELFMLVY